MTVESVTWIAPSGEQLPLRIGLNAQMGDVIGRYLPTFSQTFDQLPFASGGIPRFGVYQPHQFQLPINVLKSNNSDLRTALRKMVQLMDPTQGLPGGQGKPGIIRTVSPLGDTRDIECYYQAGLEMDENIQKNGRFGQQVYITFQSYDPFYKDPSDTQVSFMVDTAPSFFPLFPLRLTSSEIAVQSLVNPGDVYTWPVWKIIGPGSGILLQNVTSGQSISFETTVLGPGESITIDTRPQIKSILKNDGTNLFPDLDPTSVLWPLWPGDNAVNLQMTGVTSGAAALTLNYRKRYLSP